MESSEFYSMAAQVFVALYLALAIEQRSNVFLPDEALELFINPDSGAAKRVRASYTLFVTVVLLVGEIAAVYGLAKSAPLEFTAGHVSSIALGGLVIGAVGVIAPTMMSQFRQVLPEEVARHRRLAAVAVIALLFILAFMLFNFTQALIN